MPLANSETCGVKTYHVSEEELKKKIREKHQKSLQLKRIAALQEKRENNSYTNSACASDGGSENLPCRLSMEEWLELAQETNYEGCWGNYLPHLLLLEEEILTESLFNMYDASQNDDWSEYFSSLSS